jgi:hypothetical protein
METVSFSEIYTHYYRNSLCFVKSYVRDGKPRRNRQRTEAVAGNMKGEFLFDAAQFAYFFQIIV